ncbi:GMP synthase (glutamine-hydrolyzing) [Epichloe bromicola]
MAPNTEAEVPHDSFDTPLWTILVLDFGSQTSHLILRRLRALGVFAELLPCTTKIAVLTWKPKEIVFSGGPSSAYDEGSPLIDLFEKEAIRIEKEAEDTPNSGKVEWFLQGTLHPDVIESLSFNSVTIKTHHNAGGLPERMMKGLMEPLRLLSR